MEPAVPDAHADGRVDEVEVERRVAPDALDLGVAGRGLRRATVLLRPLRNRELRALWLSDWISDVGNFITAIALAVYINNLTGTVTGVGVVLALHSVPWFTIGPFAGVLVDRLDRRSVMIATCLCRAVLVAILPFTRAAWQVYALSFAVALFGPLLRPILRSMALSRASSRTRDQL